MPSVPLRDKYGRQLGTVDVGGTAAGIILVDGEPVVDKRDKLREDTERILKGTRYDDHV
jgi:hypothetical protein